MVVGFRFQVAVAVINRVYFRQDMASRFGFAIFCWTFQVRKNIWQVRSGALVPISDISTLSPERYGRAVCVTMVIR